MKTWLALGVMIGLVLGGASACRRGGDDLTAAEAAAVLRGSTDFTARAGSLVGRRLEDVVVVRRIGRSSTEVEFTWRDYPLPPGQTGALKTSMALFRKDNEGRWALAALFRVQ